MSKSGEHPRPIARIAGEHAVGPDEETKVPCPVCLGSGMVSPAIAQKIAELLAGASDGPASTRGAP